MSNYPVLIPYGKRSIRTVILNGVIKFSATDICNILGYIKANKILGRYCDSTPEYIRLHTPGGVQSLRMIEKSDIESMPDGGALSGILSRHFVRLQGELIEEGILPEDARFKTALKKKVYAMLDRLEADVGGFDFARVLGEYYTASIEEDTRCQSACLRWLRGEFSTKTEARQALGFSVGTVIGDDNWYDFIKLFSSLSVELGFRGLILFIDECVNLYKIPNRISREANYEKILSIFNDTLQGKATHFGVIFGGTPQFLEDTRRGLFSYDALKSRLSDSRYAIAGYQNLSSPVIRLRRLSDNELLALVRRLTKLYAQREGLSEPPLTDEQIAKFMTVALSRTGASEMITPREIIRDFLTLLNILRDNSGADFDTLVGKLTFEEQDSPAQTPVVKKEKIDIFDIEI